MIYLQISHNLVDKSVAAAWQTDPQREIFFTKKDGMYNDESTLEVRRLNSTLLRKVKKPEIPEIVDCDDDNCSSEKNDKNKVYNPKEGEELQKLSLIIENHLSNYKEQPAPKLIPSIRTSKNNLTNLNSENSDIKLVPSGDDRSYYKVDTKSTEKVNVLKTKLISFSNLESISKESFDVLKTHIGITHNIECDILVYALMLWHTSEKLSTYIYRSFVELLSVAFSDIVGIEKYIINPTQTYLLSNSDIYVNIAVR